jgi:hypothetical protein
MSGRRLTPTSVRALCISLLVLPPVAVAGDSRPSIDPWLGATLGGGLSDPPSGTAKAERLQPS